MIHFVDASWRWRLSKPSQDSLSHVTARKLASPTHPRREIPDLHLDTSPQECAVKMQQSPKIHGQPTEGAVPMKVSSKSPKKSHDPLVHLLAGA